MEMRLNTFNGEGDFDEWSENARQCLMEVRDGRNAGVLRGRTYDEMKLQPESVKEDYELLSEALYTGHFQRDCHQY